jgi:hypothetical protein
MFYICNMEKILNIKQIRIELICQKIRQGASSEEIIEYVNKKINSKISNEVNYGKRTFENDLKSIREGDFMFSNNIKPIGDYYFFISYKKSENKYYFNEAHEEPEFDEITEEERLTIPFIIGILKQYESLPAVKKIISRIDDLFEIDSNNKTTFFSPQPKLIEEDKTIKKAIQLLKHIKNKECVEFNYITVHKLNTNSETKKIKKVTPIQIRIHDNLYYLIGFDLEKKELKNFKIDQIFNKIDALCDENEEIIYFDPKDKIITSIDERFKNTLGVWVNNEEVPISKVKIKFRDWAANYVSKIKLHSTQKIINIDFDNNEIIIELELKLYNLKEPVTTINDLDPELAFLLGRFRDYCEIIEIK